MSVHPTMAPFLASIAPLGSVHRHPAESCGTYSLNERARIAADLKRNADKNSGALAQREIDRAHAEEVKAGVHQ
jgi:hypothetical protein